MNPKPDFFILSWRSYIRCLFSDVAHTMCFPNPMILRVLQFAPIHLHKLQLFLVAAPTKLVKNDITFIAARFNDTLK